MASTPSASSVASRSSLRTADWQTNAAHNNKGKRSRALFISDDEPSRNDLRWQLPDVVQPPSLNIPALQVHTHSHHVRVAEPTPLYSVHSSSSMSPRGIPSPRRMTTRWVADTAPPVEPTLFSISPQRSGESALRSRAEQLIEEIDSLRARAPEVVPEVALGGPVSYNSAERKPRPAPLDTVERISTEPRAPPSPQLPPPPSAVLSPQQESVVHIGSDDDAHSTFGLTGFRDGSEDTTVQHFLHATTSTSPIGVDVETRDSVTSPLPVASPLLQVDMVTSPMRSLGVEMATSPLPVSAQDVATGTDLSPSQRAVCVPLVKSLPVVQEAQTVLPDFRSTSLATLGVGSPVTSPLLPRQSSPPRRHDGKEKESLEKVQRQCAVVLQRHLHTGMMRKYYQKLAVQASPVMLEMPLDVYTHEGFRLKQPKSPMSVKRLKLKFAGIMAGSLASRLVLARFFRKLLVHSQQRPDTATLMRMQQAEERCVKWKHATERCVKVMQRQRVHALLQGRMRKWQVWASARRKAADVRVWRATHHWLRFAHAMRREEFKHVESKVAKVAARNAGQEETIYDLCEQQRLSHAQALMRSTRLLILGRAYRKLRAHAVATVAATTQSSILRLERAHERYDAMMRIQVKSVMKAADRRRAQGAYNSLHNYVLRQKGRRSAALTLQHNVQRVCLTRFFRLLAANANILHFGRRSALLHVRILQRRSSFCILTRYYLRLTQHRADVAITRRADAHNYEVRALRGETVAARRRTLESALKACDMSARNDMHRCFHRLLLHRAQRRSSASSTELTTTRQQHSHARHTVASLVALVATRTTHDRMRTLFRAWLTGAARRRTQRTEAAQYVRSAEHTAVATSRQHLAARFHRWAAVVGVRIRRSHEAAALLLQGTHRHMRLRFAVWTAYVHSRALRRTQGRQADTMLHRMALQHLRTHYSTWHAHRSQQTSTARALHSKLTGVAHTAQQGSEHRLLAQYYHMLRGWLTSAEQVREKHGHTRRVLRTLRHAARLRLVSRAYAQWRGFCRARVERFATACRIGGQLARRTQLHTVQHAWAALTSNMTRRRRRRRREDEIREVQVRYCDILTRRTTTTQLRHIYTRLLQHRGACIGLRSIKHNAARQLLHTTLARWRRCHTEQRMQRDVDALKESLAATASFYDDCVSRTERRHKRVCARACAVLTQQLDRALLSTYWTRLTKNILQCRISRAITRLPSKQQHASVRRGHGSVSPALSSAPRMHLHDTLSLSPQRDTREMRDVTPAGRTTRNVFYPT